MSIINFRAWDTANKRMTNRGIFIDSNGNVFYDTDVNGVQMSGKITVLPTDRFIVMLWTGYNDNNNTPIYEGDIFGNNLLRCLVFKDANGEFKLLFQHPKMKGKTISITDRLVKSSKVIGNKYQHPELV